ncbi:hypothetical protein BJ912DRAFT_1061209 [Pholiota molesta]|nr:hypothetical protein BJ912DRAFT_1061209 [Pholiota molesta]
MVKIKCGVDQASTSHVDPSGVILSLSRSYSNVMPDINFHTLVYLPILYAHECQLMLFSDGMAERLDIANYTTVTAGLKLKFEWTASPLSTQCITKVLTSIFGGALPLRDVSMHLDLRYSKGLSVGTLAKTLGTLPQVRSIMAGRHTSRTLLKTLQFKLHLEEEESTCPIRNCCFPQLSSIYFENTKFWVPFLSDFLQDPTSISVELLKNVLDLRSNCGAKIEKLSVQCCRNLGKHDVHSLSQVVGEIDWDGLESYSDSDGEDDE